MVGDDAFDIPVRPERRFLHGSALEYEGGSVFALSPAVDGVDPALRDLVEGVLTDGPYRYGDFLELPMPLWLVRDEETRDSFRVSVRDGEIRLHVLPTTESAGLRAMYDRLRERSGHDWAVTCRTEE